MLHGDEFLRRSRHAYTQLQLRDGQATCVILLSMMQEAVEQGSDPTQCRVFASLHTPSYTKTIMRTAMFGTLHQAIFSGVTNKVHKGRIPLVIDPRARTY